jgi:hypothetical protein
MAYIQNGDHVLIRLSYNFSEPGFTIDGVLGAVDSAQTLLNGHYSSSMDRVGSGVNSHFGGEPWLIDIEGVDEMQDDQTTTDEDTVEPEVGMMVRINNAFCWGEIIAIRRTPDIYHRENEYYHIAYASDTGVRLTCFRRRSNLQVQPIGEAQHNKFTVSDMLGAQKPSKYGSFADIAEAAIAAEVDDRPHHTDYSKGLERFRRFCADQDLYGSHLPKYLTTYIHMAQAEEEGANIKLYLTAKDRKRDRLTSMKPGRALRHMFPNAHDTKIASATEAWIESTQPRDFTLVVGKERIDFRNAYNGTRGDYRNPACTDNRKSLATSCMQDVDVYSDGVHISPTEAYASGDFEIAYLTNGKEASAMRIFGRVVFAPCSEEIASGPVYGACEQSLDILHKYLNDRAKDDGHETVHFDIDGGWYGLRLLAIRDRNDRLVGPYIDGDISGDLVGNFIKLSSRGGLNFESTDGTIEGVCSCEYCGDGVSDDEAYHDNNGQIFCEGCFSEHYVFLEDGDVVSIDEAAHANYYSARYTHQGWFMLDDVVHCECVDEYWVLDDCTYAELTDQYVPNKIVNQFPELFDDDFEEEDA